MPESDLGDRFPRLWGEALTAIKGLLSRRSSAGRDGFVERFPVAHLATLLEARLAQATLSKTDWIAIGSIGKI